MWKVRGHIRAKAPFSIRGRVESELGKVLRAVLKQQAKETEKRLAPPSPTP